MKQVRLAICVFAYVVAMLTHVLLTKCAHLEGCLSCGLILAALQVFTYAILGELDVVGGIVMLCAFFAYYAWHTGNENAHLTFQKIGLWIALLSTIDRNGRGRRKLLRKLKVAALTAVSATAFKRQVRRAFSHAR